MDSAGESLSSYSESTDSIVFGPQLPPVWPRVLENEVYDRETVDAFVVPESFPSYHEAMEFLTTHDFADRAATRRFIEAVYTDEYIAVFGRFGQILREIYGEFR